MPDLDVNTLVGAVVVLLGSIGGTVLALGRSPARRMYAALTASVERHQDGTLAPKPGGALDLFMDSIAARVADRIGPDLTVIRSDISSIRTQMAAAREREIEAAKHEERQERDFGSLKVALVNRIARLEGAAGVPVELHGDRTPITEMIAARRVQQ